MNLLDFPKYFVGCSCVTQHTACVSGVMDPCSNVMHCLYRSICGGKMLGACLCPVRVVYGKN